ncbi:DUF58 domain-containing protein [Carboxylicivirga marina]|uniref:DUF58 domain-containing protein n=1 Tax=Carboxylicivirga marina TaxID=2800988 RepID=A0ABS1HFI3_9BACT|nr:DUF58 domain-containing protein [Carboxylicivirga marina]MBK3516428.1 DUF58 domain-containing protein [Carboxylicivirga marina]
MNKVSVTLRALLKWEHLILGTDILPRQRVSSILAGRHYSMMRGRGLDFEEVRNYVPGDDIRNIDWKVTARTKKTHTKVFNEEKERPALVLVDQSSYMRFGSQNYLKSVIAAEAAALAAFRTIKKGDRCGGLVFNDDTMDWFSPRRSRQAVLQLLKSVSEHNAILLNQKHIKNNGLQLEHSLKRIANYITHDYILSIISDFSQCTVNGYKLIRKIAQHNDVICVHIEDELDLITDKNNMIISDGEKQLFWKKSKSKVIQSEKQDNDGLKDKLNTLQRKYRIPVIYLNTQQTLEDQIKSIFKSR